MKVSKEGETVPSPVSELLTPIVVPPPLDLTSLGGSASQNSTSVHSDEVMNADIAQLAEREKKTFEWLASIGALASQTTTQPVSQTAITTQQQTATTTQQETTTTTRQEITTTTQQHGQTEVSVPGTVARGLHANVYQVELGHTLTVKNIKTQRSEAIEKGTLIWIYDAVTEFEHWFKFIYANQTYQALQSEIEDGVIRTISPKNTT